MSSVEMVEKSVRLGSSQVAVTYPETLHLWFDGLVEPRDRSVAPRKWVHLKAHKKTALFDVVASVGTPSKRLDLGEALATFWERASFLLVDDLSDAIALHAAALRQNNGVVLVPGRSSAGKTRLSLWYRARGFVLGTDEIVTTAFGPNGVGDLVLGGVLARPVIIKTLADPMTLLRPEEVPRAQQEASCGLIVRLEDAALWTQKTIDRGLIVFPYFTPGAPFKLKALTAGEACLRLLENCLNARNLPRGGLPFASLLARRLQAISLDYGETGQLEGTLDVLTRQLLAAPSSQDDLAALCAAFTASAESRAICDGKSDTTAKPALDTTRRVAPIATVARFPRRLTIGMATYNDYDGVYFTVQSIRNSNPELDGALEYVVIDNNPDGPSAEALSHFAKSVDGCRYIPRGDWTGTAIRNAVFEEASSQSVLCIDSHVLIAPGAVSKLIAYFEADPDNCDLLQGPMIADDLRQTATHLEPQWRAGMYGTWGYDPRGLDPVAPIFDIPMQGLGLFACRRAAWPGFNPKFRGFGGEEGYIHEKIRQRGGRTLCLPFLRWIHRFNRPAGVPYVNRWEDRMRNYMIGFIELGLDTGAMEAHFAELLGAETSARIFIAIKTELKLR